MVVLKLELVEGDAADGAAEDAFFAPGGGAKGGNASGSCNNSDMLLVWLLV